MELSNSSILIIAILVIIFLLIVLYFCFRTTPRLEKQRLEAERAKKIKEETSFKVETEKPEPCTVPDIPVLKCYDYFELPDSGSYTVKTCGINQKKLFVQWFPVNGAQEYIIYANKGSKVSSDNYIKKWTVPKGNHYLETEELGGDCWSVLISSVNDCGESLTSKIFTTCI